jgi:hypothetical protein
MTHNINKKCYQNIVRAKVFTIKYTVSSTYAKKMMWQLLKQEKQMKYSLHSEMCREGENI